MSLFDRELNELFVWIADTMNKNQEYNTVANNERLYYGLVKRRVAAAKYVKETYLKGRVSGLTYSVRYPLVSLKYALLGNARNVARYVFRRIFVK